MPTEQDIRHPLKIAIVGASGYSGLELTKLLIQHKFVRLEKLFANTSAGKRVGELFPRLDRRLEMTYREYSAEAACTSDLVFVALPSGEAMNIVPELLKRGKKVIDLGGDFRLRGIQEYERYYRRPHSAADLLAQSTYGLPEWHRRAIEQSSFVANPGCYPTGAILPLAPLLREKVIDDEGIVVSSLSGVSGAGRSASPDLSFVEVNESVKAYRVGQHQHIPEIHQALQDIAARSIEVTFVPHLIPITRGIYTSIYATLARKVTESDIFDIYQRFYGNEPFVRVSSTAIPELKNIVMTNYIDIGFRIDGRRLMVFSAIDNLLKGAAGQAVQNMNLMTGMDETEGLL